MARTIFAALCVPVPRHARNSVPTACPHDSAGRGHDEGDDGTLRGQPLPGVEHLAHEVAERHHELDQLLEDAHECHSGAADDQRLPDRGWTVRHQGAQHGQHGTAANGSDEPQRQPETEGEHGRQGWRQCDEHRAQVDRLHRQHEQGGEEARERARDEAQHQDRPTRPADPASGNDDAGAEAEGDQHSVAERQHVDDDPPLVDQRQQADKRQIDGGGAEEESGADGAPCRRALHPPRAGRPGRHRQARFVAMRCPKMPCGRKIRTMIRSVKAMRSRSW